MLLKVTGPRGDKELSRRNFRRNLPIPVLREVVTHIGGTEAVGVAMLADALYEINPEAEAAGSVRKRKHAALLGDKEDSTNNANSTTSNCLSPPADDEGDRLLAEYWE
mmetsp:Transcript_7803/g.13190  ORF Transcript_7803/g.13190 Transcript_7803/m.13190 type:complete len:108 (+) Transcript_7803:573-896(+)